MDITDTTTPFLFELERDDRAPLLHRFNGRAFPVRERKVHGPCWYCGTNAWNDATENPPQRPGMPLFRPPGTPQSGPAGLEAPRAFLTTATVPSGEQMGQPWRTISRKTALPGGTPFVQWGEGRGRRFLQRRSVLMNGRDLPIAY